MEFEELEYEDSDKESASDTVACARATAARLSALINSLRAQMMLFLGGGIILSFAIVILIFLPLKWDFPHVFGISAELIPSLALICLFVNFRILEAAFQIQASRNGLLKLQEVHNKAIFEAEAQGFLDR